MRRTQQLLILSALALLLGPGVARAQTFTFDQPALTGAPGATLPFSGTLSNLENTPLFLNGDSVDLIPTDLTVDDQFLLNAPVSLAPVGDPSGMDIWTGTVFDVDIGVSALPGDYVGTFTVFGGADANAQDTLVTQNFLVTVAAPAVPEPSALGLFLSGLVALRLFHSSRRKD